MKQKVVFLCFEFASVMGVLHLHVIGCRCEGVITDLINSFEKYEKPLAKSSICLSSTCTLICTYYLLYSVVSDF